MRYKTFTDDNETVVVVSSYAGKAVRGIAKCCPNDEFDYEKGEELARARCDQKVAKKRYKNAMKCYDDAKEWFKMAESYLLDMREYAASSEKEFYKAEANLKSVLTKLK